MKRWVLDMLCCPVCKGSFILSETKDNGNEISEGKLTCSVCGKCYPIENGIASLLPDNLR
ncbi:MAG TPA: methytransferase partner Trm112 [Methanocorpusculum sp.]|nr:methytransferase partner Trm112 [Methanocorpusculum sp.]